MAAGTSDNLYARLAEAFRRQRGKVLVDAGSRALNGADLLVEAETWARALGALGVARGDRVCVQVEKSLEAVLLYLACLRHGAVFVPLNTAYRRGEIAYFLGDARPALFVCSPADEAAYAPLASDVGARLVTLGADGDGSLADRVDEGGPALPAPALGPEDLAVIVYTSGTTGRSKGAMITHGALVSNAGALIGAWGFTEDDVLLHALPLYHIHGLFVGLNTTLMVGGTVLMQPGFDPGEVIGALPRASLFMGVPTYYTRLLADARFDRAASASIRLFVCGSAPLLVETFDAFEARTGKRILERYGMSEAGMICSNPLRGERRPGWVGPPLAGVQVRVADAEGAVLDRSEIGVLEVRGPNLFAGYWKMPEQTRKEFRDDGFFITGDVATIADDGYVQIVGRAKDLIICGGLNVYPKEIETLIDALPGVEESAVVGLPHPDFGEAVAAVVRPKPGETLSAEALIRAVKGEIAGFKVPKAVFFVDELPRNAMGKVQKAALRDRYAGAFRS